MSTDGGSNYNVSKTTTAGYSYNDEAAHLLNTDTIPQKQNLTKQEINF